MSNREAANRLSRLRNQNKPCDHCNRAIERLSEHLDAVGRHTCRFMSVSERTRLTNEAISRQFDDEVQG
jgi:hypothetical protein